MQGSSSQAVTYSFTGINNANVYKQLEGIRRNLVSSFQILSGIKTSRQQREKGGEERTREESAVSVVTKHGHTNVLEVHWFTWS